MKKEMVLSLFIFIFSLTLYSQMNLKPPHPPLPPSVESYDIEDELSLNEEERERARFFLAYRLKEKLNLKEEQTLKLLDILKEAEMTRLKHHERMKELRKIAYEKLKNENINETEIKKLVEEIKRIKEEKDLKTKEIEEKILSILTPRQQLEYLLFKKEIYKCCLDKAPLMKQRGKNN